MPLIGKAPATQDLRDTSGYSIDLFSCQKWSQWMCSCHKGILKEAFSLPYWRKCPSMPNHTRTELKISGKRSHGVINPVLKNYGLNHLKSRESWEKSTTAI